jgi:hypothetical protein
MRHATRHQKALALVALAILGACATQRPPAAVSPGPGVQTSAEAAATVAEAQALAGLEVRQQHTAALAEQQSAWPQAAASLDVLLAIHPADNELAARRARAQQAAQGAGADRVRRAKQAQQRGETDAASRLYLDALAQDPGQSEAAEALRGIERERLRRTVLGVSARTAAAGRAAPPGTRLEALMAPSTGAPGADRNEVEHASLLAAHGEIEGAIALLKPLGGGRSADPMARSLLADLYFRQAQALLPADRPGATAALERAVQTDAGHAGAAAQLQQLKRTGKAPATGK